MLHTMLGFVIVKVNFGGFTQRDLVVCLKLVMFKDLTQYSNKDCLAAMDMPCVYSNKWGFYLQVDLMCYKATNRKPDKIFFYICMPQSMHASKLSVLSIWNRIVEDLNSDSNDSDDNHDINLIPSRRSS